MIRRATAVVLLAWSIQVSAAPSCSPLLARTLFPVTAAGGSWTTDPSVRAVAASRRARVAGCGGDAYCIAGATAWRPDEKAVLVKAAGRTHSAPVAPGDTAVAAIGREIDGLNGVLAVYADDAPARYPAIDGPDDPKGSPARAEKVGQAVSMAATCAPTGPLRDVGAGLAAALLTTNGRANAIAFAPVDVVYNRGAAHVASAVDWRRYRYAALAVLGIGPEEVGVRVSDGSTSNARLAALRFRRGLAPLIVVSGGAVHPRHTRFVEAIEMRRILIHRFGIPADRIVVDPYARHTTTNLRNVARRLAAIGVPLNRDVLVLTNPDQSRYISSADFTARNARELGYQPGSVGERLGPNDLAFRPSSRSLRVDPADPLDP